MKRTFTNCVLILLCIQASAQWTLIPSGTSIYLNDVHFPSDSIGYIVGGYGLVLKSTDAGDTWQTVHLDSSCSFSSVFFTNNDTGYVAGVSVYKTTNGGTSWTEILTDSFNSIIEVYFVSDNLGFASGESPLYKTTDGGNTWTTPITGGIYSSIYFPSDSVGYFIGGPGGNLPLYKTIDGGQSFIPITNGFQSIKEAVHFINDTIGFMGGWYSPMLVKTTDGGMSWQYLDTINYPNCWDVYFSNENVGYYIDNGGGTYVIRNTTDGGASWTTQLSGAGIRLSAFFFINPSAAVAVGESGTIYKTTNGGEPVGVGGIGEKKNEIIIYPNPFSSSTTIEFKNKNGENHTLTIYNSNGQLVRKIENIANGRVTIERENLKNGLYFFRLMKNSERVGIGKVIIE